jgi:hypothetical protein
VRHTFVSLMSDSGVAVEEIARLASHATSRTTEIVHRHQLRPVIEKGAQAMDQLFGRTASPDQPLTRVMPMNVRSRAWGSTRGFGRWHAGPLGGAA